MVLVVLYLGGCIVAYFLKKTKLKGRTYLAIYESFYNHDKKGTAHKCFESLGSVETNVEKGIADPISHFQKKVDELNFTRKQEKVQKISSETPILSLGYFLIKAVMEKLDVKKYVDYFKLIKKSSYDLYDLLSSLIYARSVHPCSKRKTFHDVLPTLFEPCKYSYDQLLDGLGFLGVNYEKFVEMFTMLTDEKFNVDTEKTYFDCTNFYFEIDKEDDFRKKGPSKENRKDPIIGLGLLLDKNQIPVGMKLYPGNQCEKPILRDVIDQLKRQNRITGRTIHVADKGLNCADNIAFSKINGDGYLFSRAVKNLPEKEKTWVLLKKDFKNIKDENGKILYYYKSCVDKFKYSVNYNGKKTTIDFTEKRLVTYNPDLAAKKKFEINRMVEKAKSLTASSAKRETYGESAKYVTFKGKEGEKASVSINQNAIDKDLQFAGYNLLVTSETNMSDQDIYHTYHNLWRIEESFRIMKTDLDARPVFLRKEETIKGHFLICYLTVLLERILQFKILGDKHSSNEIFEFIRHFKAIKVDDKYINIAIDSPFIQKLTEMFSLPLTNYVLTEKQIKEIMTLKLKNLKK
jgi:transposase